MLNIPPLTDLEAEQALKTAEKMADPLVPAGNAAGIAAKPARRQILENTPVPSTGNISPALAAAINTLPAKEALLSAAAAVPAAKPTEVNIKLVGTHPQPHNLPPVAGATPSPILTQPPVVPPPVPPAPVATPQKNSDFELIMQILLDGPAFILEAQETYDRVSRNYTARLVELSIEALSKPLFPGKKAEDEKRAAGNDTERDMAVQQVCVQDEKFIGLATYRDESMRALRYEINRFEGAKLAAQLIASSLK